jgi:hypothetical protein
VVIYSQVLEVSAGQLVVGDDLDLALASLGDDDGVAKVANAAIDLDLVLEELLEGGGVEDLVASGLLSVDDELGGMSAFLPRDREGEYGRVAYLLGDLGLLALRAGLLLQ